MHGDSADRTKMKFQKLCEEYKVPNIISQKIDELSKAIGKKNKAIIYNVTTNKKYQRNGACKLLMSDIIHDLIKLNINEICVQTEQDFYTEQVYKNMGFIEKMLGKAYIEKE